jgi:DNA-binding PadR family transcriptional regulator
MKSAELVVLGALAAGPAHGYELRRRLVCGLGPIWRIAPSQLYALLPRLERAGLVQGEEVAVGSRPPRRVYSLTPAGRAALWEWLTSPVRHVRDIRLELLAKLYFLRRLGPEHIPALISRQRERLVRLRERLVGLESLPVDDPALSRLTIEFRLAQIDAILAWLAGAAEELGGEGGEHA